MQTHVVNESLKSLVTFKSFLDKSMQLTEETALEIAQTDKDESSVKLNQLRNEMLNFCKLEREIEQFAKAAENVRQQAAESDEVIDVGALLAQSLKEIQSKNQDSALKQHRSYTTMEENIQEALQADEEADATAPREIQVDEDLAMTEPIVNTKCPVTLQEMVNPVQNKYCNHNYDLEGARQIIANRGARARCPVAGCANTRQLIESDLIANKELKRTIDRKNRKARKNK